MVADDALCREPRKPPHRALLLGEPVHVLHLSKRSQELFPIQFPVAGKRAENALHERKRGLGLVGWDRFCPRLSPFVLVSTTAR